MSTNFFRAHPYAKAVAFMVISTASFSLMSVFIRFASAELHTTMIVFLRNILTTLVLLPWALKDNCALLRTTRLKSHFWRASVGIIGMQSWFYCVAVLPLNQATALSFTAPIFSTVFAILIFKERADVWRWAAIACGFVGVLIILRPASDQFTLTSLLVLFTTSVWALAGMLIKSLTRSESPLRIVFFMVLFMSLWSFPLALMHWQWPSLETWGYIAIIAVFAFSMQLCLAKAYSLSEVVKMVPYDFTRLIFTAIGAYLAFGETSDLYTWLGAAIIVSGALANARRDAKSSEVPVA